MGVGLFLLILLLNLGLHVVKAGDWQDPPFICLKESERDKDITNCEWENDVQVLQVSINEEIDHVITIAYVMCNDCETEVPEFTEGFSYVLGPVLEKESGKWALKITKKQDYEVVTQQQYKFRIGLKSYPDQFEVKLTVNNIDDNEPIIIVRDRPCKIDENYNGTTDCTYEMEDPDGWSCTRTYFNPENMKDTFEIVIDKEIDKYKVKGHLNVLQDLDFETLPLYYFTYYVEDTLPNVGSANILIEVQDVNDMPPKWQNIFATATFPENEEKTFKVSAQDGDTLNAHISYKIGTDTECHENIAINDDGIIHVKPIDRDVLEQDLITCTFIAYETECEKMQVSAEITFIITDVNDNPPLIEPKTIDIEIPENTFTDVTKVQINDKDIGVNAQYTVLLEDVDSKNVNWYKAFQIMPTSGYQEWEFSVTVANPALIDYDRTDDWHKFTIQIKSDDGVHKEYSKINIIVLNMNDEIPKFTKANYIVEIPETILANEHIETVEAIDEDKEDSIEYSFPVDSLNEMFSINTETGKIITIKNNALDYEKQQQIFIQVQARDTLEDGVNPLHTVFSQVTINVIDVNDEKPRITLPSESPLIKEHSDVGKKTERIVMATDVDTGAHLKFIIDWENTWASKQSRQVDPDQYVNIFDIETDYVDGNKGNAYGNLVVLDKVKLDYEEFEVIYLSIIANDTKQEVNLPGTDSATLTVRIQDINDNAPKFDETSITKRKFVEEISDKDVLIATVLATDIDGPNFNKITYTLTPTNGTDDGLVYISPDRGEIFVTGEPKIDADYPDPTYYLYYNVMACDGELSDTRLIEIYVIDKNNQIPYLEKPLTEFIHVKEETSKKYLQTAFGRDLDRDEPYNLITYGINTVGNPDLINLFSIDQSTGVISVNVTDGFKLDRDDGPESYTIFLTLRDNYGQGNVNNDYSFMVILDDINNKAPELEDMATINIRENWLKGREIDNAKIRANDRDKLGTDNTKIEYSIVNVYNERNEPVEGLFGIKTVPVENEQKYDGVIYTLKDLEGYYNTKDNTYTIHIRARDFGTDPGPLESEKNYTIYIEPYNFKEPRIDYPKNNERIILKEGQAPGKTLIKIDDRTLDKFKATDDQGDKFEMLFEFLTTDNKDEDLFDLTKSGGNGAELQLKRALTEDDKTEFSLTIRAYHTGEGSASRFTDRNFQVIFIDPEASPTFLDGARDHTVEFLENHKDICEKIPCSMPVAFDPKCENMNNEECYYNIYYYIFPPDYADIFTIDYLDKECPKVCLLKELDRETLDYYNMFVVASNYDKPPITMPANTVPLNLTVLVEDENDNPPSFVKKLFSGSLTSTDNADWPVVELEATDPDILDEGKLKYSILQDTMWTSDPSLADIQDKAFQIKQNIIYSTFKPTDSMKGYFKFNVQVDDDVGGVNHSDIAEVKIYIISNSNRIVFTFNNDVLDVKEERDFIELVFSEEFILNCTIDDIYIHTDADSGEAVANRTDVKTHFIDELENLPVDPSVINLKTNDLETIARLRTRFLSRGLNFNDVPVVDKDLQNMEELLQTLLIVVSVVLGTLCIVLFLAFIIRTRSLKKRLDAMTFNDFGSTNSGLNRLATNAPGTNKHAIEANPVWNEDLNKVTQFDAVSQGSGGSDLIGIEDSPEFQYSKEERRDSINPVIEESRRKSLNPMASSLNDIDPSSFKPSY